MFATPHAGIWMAVIGAILFSGKAIVIKLAYAYPVSASTLLAMRMLLSMPLFAIAWLWSERRNQQRTDNQQLALSKHDMFKIVLAGLLGYYAASLLDFMGLQYISAGLERLILFTYPSIVLLLTCIIQRTLPGWWPVLAMIISYCGLWVVYGHEASLNGEHASLGALLVLASSISYAAYLVLGGSLLKRLGTIRVTSLATLVSGTVILLQISIEQPWSVIWNQPAQVWGLSLINAIFCTVLPVLTVMMAIAKIGAAKVAQIGMIGPLSTIGMGTIILNESFTVWHLAGTLLVLAGVALLSFKPSSLTH